MTALHTPAESGYVFVLVMGSSISRADGHKVMRAGLTVGPHPVNRMCHRVQCSSVPHSRKRTSTCSVFRGSRGNYKTCPEASHSFRQLPKIGCGRVHSLILVKQALKCLIGLLACSKRQFYEFVHKSRHRWKYKYMCLNNNIVSTFCSCNKLGSQ